MIQIKGEKEMINKNALKLCGVNEEDFLNWCRENKKPAYLNSSKTKFFMEIHQRKLTKDSDGKLIKK